MWSKEEAKPIVHPLGNERGLGVLDSLLVCIVMGVLVGIFIPQYESLAQETKETALRSGLANMRKAVELYHALQGRYPAELKILLKQKYAVAFREDTLFSGEYLTAMAADQEGNLIDPFGNRYRYDNKNGAVASGTFGYEKW